jgi:hypothetical protein
LIGKVIIRRQARIRRNNRRQFGDTILANLEIHTKTAREKSIVTEREKSIVTEREKGILITPEKSTLTMCEGSNGRGRPESRPRLAD